MKDDSDDDGKKKKDSGKLLTFPGGKKLDPSEVGAEFVVGQSGHIPTPELQDPSQVEKDYRERLAFVQNQELVRAVDRKASTSEMIDVLLKEISEETSHLKFEREKVSKSGKSTVNFNMARIASLRSLAELLLKRKEVDLAEHVDFKSERFQKIFNLWIEFFHDSMEKSGVTAEVIDLVFKQMRADMIDWEKKMDAVG